MAGREVIELTAAEASVHNSATGQLDQELGERCRKAPRWAFVTSFAWSPLPLALGPNEAWLHGAGFSERYPTPFRHNKVFRTFLDSAPELWIRRPKLSC